MKRCKQCGIEKKYDEFYFRKERQSYRAICKDCTRINSKKYRGKHRENVRDLVGILKTPCVRCGYDMCKQAIDFHHRDESCKKYDISTAIYSISTEEIILEIEKCVCLCSNCHREFHYLEREMGIALDYFLERPEAYL